MDVGSAENFTRMGTVGIEEEFYVVDERGRPTSGTDELVYETDPPPILDGRLDHELFKCVIETQTPTCADLDEAHEKLHAVRAALVDHAETHGYGIAAAGLHPAAKWRELEHAEKPRYRAQLDRIQYPQHRNTTAGIHVHVGVDDAEKATWVANEVRWFLPVMLALSANSPYWYGFDTGLASARAKIFENLPNTGVPTAFRDFAAYRDFERLMVERDSINDRGELWYDVRPHTENGTVEVRAPDGQADPEAVFAFVEYVHALVMDLAERYERTADPWATYRSGGADSSAPPLRRELLDENKWRALRYGHDATFIDRDGTDIIGFRDAIEREADRLGVDGIARLAAAESGAARQRRLLESEGLDGVCAALML
ncbi:glutamate--cysteine ligase [Halococcus hamelinensis]|uniref:Glutamate--cysteine ligase n=1 Tax=Halococcus hamelinensis 100A6 TaxID=1132509 RepID=M0M5S8_9EURY|nr:glutamate--cysteine ligase [Halococcus hamelinensis]EMA39735.1 carboxylate-amine ligase [Halococcus hamelinensis 100A6]